MKFSYNWLQSFFDEKLPTPHKLAELLTMHFAEVEGVEKYVQDFILDIDIRPNRAGDCFSHFGVVREIAAILGLGFKKIEVKLKEDKKLWAKDYVSLTVQNKKACPRYSARVVDKVKVASSPPWLKNRLLACGLKPINNIVDIANYVMLETGQPLHAFDAAKLVGNKIVVRSAKAKESIITLDDQKFSLTPAVLVIADQEKPVAIAGVKGGKQAEVDKDTKTIVLESANFDFKTVRQTGQQLNLKTDASLRFEHGIDLNLTELAINRAAYLIQELAQGRVAQGLLGVGSKRPLVKKITFDLKYLKSLLGIAIPEQTVKKILISLGFRVTKTKKDVLQVTVPSFRLDVTLPEDLVEEVGRIYGYQNIPAEFPVTVLTPVNKNMHIFWENTVKDIFKELGFFEVYNYSFISDKEVEVFNYDKKELIELENPLSAEYKYLSISLIPNLLKNVERNYKEFKNMRVFEIGKVFKAPAQEGEQLTGLIVGEDFLCLKGILEILFERLGVQGDWCYATKEKGLEFRHANKYAAIMFNKELVGFLGEVNPKLLENFKIKNKVVLFDLDFTKLVKVASLEHNYKMIPKYPSAMRDIAVLVPEKVPVAEVFKIIYKAGKELVCTVELFDIYQGKELPKGKKNLAFHIIYQAKDRTLTAEEIEQKQKEIIQSLEKVKDWTVRK